MRLNHPPNEKRSNTNTNTFAVDHTTTHFCGREKPMATFDVFDTGQATPWLFKRFTTSIVRRAGSRGRPKSLSTQTTWPTSWVNWRIQAVQKQPCSCSEVNKL